jgi:hypothetical protein
MQRNGRGLKELNAMVCTNAVGWSRARGAERYVVDIARASGRPLLQVRWKRSIFGQGDQT